MNHITQNNKSFNGLIPENDYAAIINLKKAFGIILPKHIFHNPLQKLGSDKIKPYILNREAPTGLSMYIILNPCFFHKRQFSQTG